MLLSFINFTLEFIQDLFFRFFSKFLLYNVFKIIYSIATKRNITIISKNIFIYITSFFIITLLCDHFNSKIWNLSRKNTVNYDTFLVIFYFKYNFNVNITFFWVIRLALLRHLQKNPIQIYFPNQVHHHHYHLSYCL